MAKISELTTSVSMEELKSYIMIKIESDVLDILKKNNLPNNKDGMAEIEKIVNKTMKESGFFEDTYLEVKAEPDKNPMELLINFNWRNKNENTE